MFTLASKKGLFTLCSHGPSFGGKNGQINKNLVFFGGHPQYKKDVYDVMPMWGKDEK